MLESLIHIIIYAGVIDPYNYLAQLPTPTSFQVKLARPGRFSSVDFSRCDLWAAGALAYQFYGLPNPFFRDGKVVSLLDFPR